MLTILLLLRSCTQQNKVYQNTLLYFYILFNFSFFYQSHFCCLVLFVDLPVWLQWQKAGQDEKAY